ncbi:hypothetical protein L596_016005 [Steinernema carpocapsae]|uniref:Uncharacterized protein n=1 Tax=Steinernema carpocapsae TaxID=34508 RepID=A0A4U5NGQ7_STECR|nr:hypothetical protein L596_016005 [Steinernema carpocapsae]
MSTISDEIVPPEPLPELTTSNPILIPLVPMTDEVEEVCVANSECFSDGDCFGGRCQGVFVGTCTCNCFSFMMCASDKGCGGLKGSCNLKNYKCDCLKAYSKNGFLSFFHALGSFCNSRKCNGANTKDACFGMPCHAGRCSC